MEMQPYYGGGGGGGGCDGDGDWFHQLAALPPLPMSSSLPPPLLMSGEGSCLPMAATAALPLGDCSSALMIRAEEQMGCLPMIPPPAVADDVYSSYAPEVDVLPPFPAGLDYPTAGLDDALLMEPFSDIDLEEFADAVGHKIKTEPLDKAMVPADYDDIDLEAFADAVAHKIRTEPLDDAMVSADYDFAAQAHQARPVVTMNQQQQNAPRGVRLINDDDDSTLVAGGYESSAVGYAEQKQVRPAPRRVRKSSGGSGPAAGGKSLDHIGFEELRQYFYMPITKAAREMNVGLTVLKKRCRELGVARWPHRKMKSLRSLILNIQEMVGKGATSPAAVQGELEALERYCARMEENPAIELTEQTKKLRQACFKENYKRRRAAASVNLLEHCYNDLGSHEQMPLPQMGFFGF